MLPGLGRPPPLLTNTTPTLSLAYPDLTPDAISPPPEDASTRTPIYPPLADLMSASAGQQQAVPLATQAASGSGSALPIQDQLTLLQFRYTAALEKLVHANDQVAKLAEEKASLVADRAELQLRVQALLNGQQQHQQQPQGLDGSQQHHHQPHHPQQGDFQLDPALAMSSGYGVPGPSSQGAYGGGGFAQPHGGHQPTHGHRQIIYVAQPPPGPSLQQLEAARQKYDVNWNPFEGLSDEDLRQIRENTPNWDVKHLTRKVRARASGGACSLPD